ncbi:MAG: tetratricopeptide repeat protein [Oscillospiraceae bacterium]|nr:tetratricopeptide repeat protein [Oscillospiraceae bacterium]
MTLIYIICFVILVVIAYKFNVLLGAALTLAAVAFGIYSLIPSFYVLKANKAYQAGDFEEAKRQYKKAYDTNRAKLDTKVSYAYILLRTNEADEAERVLDKIIRTKGVKPEQKKKAKQQRCMVYYKQGRLDEALEEAYEIFDNGNYKNTTLYGMIGFFKYLRDDPEDALEFCLEAYEYNSDDRDIMDNLSLCYYKLGQYDKAKEISDKIISANPQFVEAYYHGAQIAVKCGEYKTAEEYLDKIPGCRWSSMTTVTHEEVDNLIKEVREKL